MANKIPSTTTTLPAASDPSRRWRAENGRAVWRHGLRMESSVDARPASASPLYHCCHSGRVNRMATAANTSATPSHPSRPRTRFNICPLSTPPLAVDRLGRQEEPKGNETEVIHDVLGIDDAAREVVEMLC